MEVLDSCCGKFLQTVSHLWSDINMSFLSLSRLCPYLCCPLYVHVLCICLPTLACVGVFA